MIIYTDDASPFRDDTKEEVFMYSTLDVIPEREDTIYFLISDKFSSEDVLKWHSIIRSKLIIITTKEPSLNKKAKEFCIVSDTLTSKEKPDDTFMAIRALINWNDRTRVQKIFKEQPLPLVNWFLKHNYKDIDFWRRMSKTMFILPERYTRAAIIYGIQPSRKKVLWPSKSKKVKETPYGFRSSDKYVDMILENSISVANHLREVGNVPQGMKKTKVDESKWF